MKNIILLASLFVYFTACSPSSSESSESENTAETTVQGGVSFVNINDGDTLTSPFLLEMGVKGMIVEPKGEPKPGVGHHHLLINDNAIPEGIIIVADSTHIHYGGGQTSDSISLLPGNYKLTLQFADGMHVSYGEKWANSINVIVK
ncbi:MAG: hypothetical protein RLZZ337_299 [Bacteroidota bacterium]|jgi:hypothetical protein